MRCGIRVSRSIANRNAASYAGAAEYEGVYFSVAIWTHPIARSLPQETWLELRRLAISPEAPKNTATRMLGVMAKLVYRDRPLIERLISYQDMDVHSGTIYRAAGWTPTTVNKGHEWNATRRREKNQCGSSDKQRWEKIIRKDVDE